MGLDLVASTVRMNAQQNNRKNSASQQLIPIWGATTPLPDHYELWPIQWARRRYQFNKLCFDRLRERLFGEVPKMAISFT